jgi:hypothetical protein
VHRDVVRSSPLSSEEECRKHFPVAAGLDERPTYIPPDLYSTMASRYDSAFLTWCGNAVLCTAIRSNAVTFPSQVMWLGRREERDVGRRIIQLYFANGWSAHQSGHRYLLSETWVHRILGEWRRRAVAAGFLQCLQSETRENMP